MRPPLVKLTPRPALAPAEYRSRRSTGLRARARRPGWRKGRVARNWCAFRRRCAASGCRLLPARPSTPSERDALIERGFVGRSPLDRPWANRLQLRFFSVTVRCVASRRDPPRRRGACCPAEHGFVDLRVHQFHPAVDAAGRFHFGLAVPASVKVCTWVRVESRRCSPGRCRGPGRAGTARGHPGPQRHRRQHGGRGDGEKGVFEGKHGLDSSVDARSGAGLGRGHRDAFEVTGSNAVQVHDAQFDDHLRCTLLHLVAEGAQCLDVHLGLIGPVGLDAVAVGHGGGAAVAMGDADHALHVVKLHRDRRGSSPGRAPLWRTLARPPRSGRRRC